MFALMLSDDTIATLEQHATACDEARAALEDALDDAEQAGSLDDAVAVFAREAATGSLRFVDAEENGVDSVTDLSRPASVIVSRDGGAIL